MYEKCSLGGVISGDLNLLSLEITGVDKFVHPQKKNLLQNICCKSEVRTYLNIMLSFYSEPNVILV